jgi:cell division protease FtsH
VKKSAKTALIWIVLIALVCLGVMTRNGPMPNPITLTPALALERIDAGDILNYRLQNGNIILSTHDGEALRVAPMDGAVIRRMNEMRIPFVQANASLVSSFSRSPSAQILLTIIIAAIVFLAVIYFFRKRSVGNVNSIFELRKTKARTVGDTDKAKFTDIGGNQDAVETFADIVDFLRYPERWKAAAARLPRGILLVGPPGTGKTLLARAVAGETNSAFFYTSATEFVEMFVGVGPARIRDTFEKAAAAQPAIIFIDELDAVGRRRGSGHGTIHEEREQTLNQLLVMLDGLERHERLVVMAATNRLDVLDPALLRSGRFDRVLRLESPSVDDRAEILKIHTRDKPLDNAVSLDNLAKRTDGFTGADLESLTNHAALTAVRRCRASNNGHGQLALTNEDFDKALKAMKRSNRQFDRLDSVIVESLSQFAEPTGRASVRVTLTTGTILEGDVLWMNAVHIKLKLADGSEVVVAKDMAEQLVSLEGTERVAEGDFKPDRWAGRDLEIG